MVRNYKPKSNRFMWKTEAMNSATEAVNNGMSQRQAAKSFGVPLTTFQRNLKGIVNTGQKGPMKPVFNTEQEENLASHLVKMQTLMYGLSTIMVRRLA